jgi:N-acetylglucosaminyl-diphospho-decaprenol L-rhamnosyltransferase
VTAYNRDVKAQLACLGCAEGERDRNELTETPINSGAMPTQVSVLTVSWNAWHDLERCLRAVFDAAVPGMEVIVIDNGSSDGTLQSLRQTFPSVRVHANAQNMGLPRAVNQGLSLAVGEYVMLLDSDTEVRPHTIACLLEFMTNQLDVDVVAPRILTPEGQIEESARSLPSWINGLFGRQSILTRLFPRNPFSVRYLGRQNLNTSVPFQVEQVSAACMFIRRSLIAEIGPWDEAYRCYWVDSDWCARLKKHGKKVYCLPQAEITHFERNRANRRKSPWRIWQFHSGAARMYRKHYTWGVLDPRTWVAHALLTVRACFLLAMNFLRGR